MLAFTFVVAIAALCLSLAAFFKNEEADYTLDMRVQEFPSRWEPKKRGRPKGSRNKPK